MKDSPPLNGSRKNRARKSLFIEVRRNVKLRTSAVTNPIYSLYGWSERGNAGGLRTKR
jgi:hypothetical protein